MVNDTHMRRRRRLDIEQTSNGEPSRKQPPRKSRKGETDVVSLKVSWPTRKTEQSQQMDRQQRQMTASRPCRQN